MLRGLFPFVKYKLPLAKDVEFEVSRTKHMMAYWNIDCNGHVIGVSTAKCKTLTSVVESVAHEMVHVAAERMGFEDHADHDAQFLRMAADVCNSLGFDFKEF